MLNECAILALVDAFGPQKLTTIGVPGNPPRDWQHEHGVARTSYGPLSLNVALTALRELAEEVHRGGGVPPTVRLLT
jgi:2-methylisocitrate lyase-like PEP mutase family enzyme